jgi:hypothetical protein
MRFQISQIETKGTNTRRNAHWRLRHERRLRVQLFRIPGLTLGSLSRYLGERRTIASLGRIERTMPDTHQQALAA